MNASMLEFQVVVFSFFNMHLNNDALGVVFKWLKIDVAVKPMYFKLKSFNVFA